MTKNFESTLALVAGTLADTLAECPQQTKALAAARPKIYLADNSRLRPDAALLRRVAEELCEQHGLIAEWPSEHFLFPTGLTIAEREKAGLPIEDKAPRRVLRKSWRLIGDCQALLADVSPFRGAHLNPVIAFEVGVAVVHQIPVFAFWTKDRGYPVIGGEPGERRPPEVIERVMGPDQVSVDGNWRDEGGNLIEDLNMVECAAIAGNFVSVSMSLAEAIGRCAEHLRHGAQKVR